MPTRAVVIFFSRSRGFFLDLFFFWNNSRNLSIYFLFHFALKTIIERYGQSVFLTDAMYHNRCRTKRLFFPLVICKRKRMNKHHVYYILWKLLFTTSIQMFSAIVCFFIETDKFHRSAHFDNSTLVASKSILSICKITGSYFIGLFIIKCLNVSTRNR